MRATVPHQAIPFTMTEVEMSLVERFEKVAQLCSDRIAIKTNENVITYEQLNRTANQLARHLLQKSGNATEPVALMLKQGATLEAGMLAVLKAGRFFVPIDMRFPQARIASILEDSRAELVITDRHNIAQARELASSSKLLALESVDGPSAAEDLRLKIPPSALAYIVYTSGSTGRPKGVIWDHRGVLHKGLSHINVMHAAPDDRISLLTSGTSNALTTTFFTLLSGAGLFPFDVGNEGLSRLAQWLLQEKISIGLFPSPLFRKLCKILVEDQQFPDLRVLRLTSENVYKSDVDLYKKHFPQSCVFVNALSCSETGIIAACQMDHQTENGGNDVPVGYSTPDKEVSVVNDSGVELCSEEIGEITIRSGYLCRGYWRNPELTQSKFKSNTTDANTTTYSTGDLGLKLADGRLVHKGRKDFRVKIRGYGVDIPEVEKTLMAHRNISEAVVVARTTESGESYLVAYFTCSRQAPTITDLRLFMKQTLADYMVPAYFMKLEAIPLTANGKFDRRALPPTDHSRPELISPYSPPTSDVEKKLVHLWEQVLPIRPIGIHDDFFDLGGYSLVAAQLLTDIKREFGQDLPVSVLANYPTVAQFAVAINTDQDQILTLLGDKHRYRYLLKLQPETFGIPVFCFSHEGNYRGGLLKFARLNRLIGSQFCFYGIRARGCDGLTKPHDSVEQMAAAYIEEIKSIQPNGPYLLIGECGNGLIALETAQQLQAGHQEVGMLLLLDRRAHEASARRYYWTRYLWRHYFPRFTYHIDRIGSLLNWHFLKKRMMHYWKQIRHLNRKVQRRDLAPKAEFAPGRRPAVEQHRTTRADEINIRYRLYSQYRLMRLRYRPRPYAGNVVLVANEEWLKIDPTLGWKDMVLGTVVIHKIPGDHNTYITQNIHLVVAAIKECLTNASVNRALSN